MRLCIVSIYFPPSVGGIERYLSDLIEALKEEGIYVDVVTASFDNQEHTEKKDFITIHRIPFLNPFDKENFRLNSRKLLIYLQKLVKKKKIDLISAQNFHKVGDVPAFSLAINMAALNTNTPLTLRVHNYCMSEIDECFLRDMLWDKIICVSNDVKEHVYDKKVPIDKIITIYPGVNTEKFRAGIGKEWLRSRIKAAKDDIVILYAGRICTAKKPILEEKGIITLMKAFSMLSPRYKNIKLLISAAKPPEPVRPLFEGTIEQIYELAKLYNISSKVIIQPFSLDEMPRVYNGCDIFAMPSQSETFGLVYAEAMSCGLPVIGTAVGGIPEIIENERNGYIIQPSDSVRLADRIELLIKNPERRRKFGEAGKKKVFEKFSLRSVTRKLIGTYDSILHNKKISKKEKISLLSLFNQLKI